MAATPGSIWQDLRDRVLAAAALHRRSQIQAGSGQILWQVGLALLAVIVADVAAPLPWWLRLPVLPVAVFVAVRLFWRRVWPALRRQHTITSAAMLVEAGYSNLNSRLVSALQLYPQLQDPELSLSPSLIRAVVRDAGESSRDLDFTGVVDPLPRRRHARLAALVIALWGMLAVALGAPFLGSVGRLWTAWGELADVARKAAGARLVVEPLARPAYLIGSDLEIRFREEGFHRSPMTVYYRSAGADTWQSQSADVDAAGHAAVTFPGCTTTFEVYAAAARIESERLTVIITERPRITRLSVEYQLPAYVRRPPYLQPRSDGKLKALFGSTVLLTIEANKAITAAAITTSYLPEPLSMNTGGEFAQLALTLDRSAWLTAAPSARQETYSLRISDQYGYENENADTLFPLTITLDEPPQIRFVGLPHRSSADEPHILGERQDTVNLAVAASDDYGITRIELHYRIEDLETGTEKRHGTIPHAFPQPRRDVGRRSLARLPDLEAIVGDRVVVWAEAQDAYALEPGSGPHLTRTPAYRLAIVTEEALFSEIRYDDEWATNWYEGIKRAALPNRAPPPKQAPASEPAAQIARKLLGALPMSTVFSLHDGDQVRRYFESLSQE